jgi:hypothetical protein
MMYLTVSGWKLLEGEEGNMAIYWKGRREEDDATAGKSSSKNSTKNWQKTTRFLFCCPIY